jgi:hypothetical protein
MRPALSSPGVSSNDEYHWQGGRDEVETQRSVASAGAYWLHSASLALEPGQRMSAYATRMLRNARIIRNTQALD